MVTSIGAMIRRDVPPDRVAEFARLVQRGLDELWVVEDLSFAGGISQAAAVLDATTGVVVGHGIAPAPFRNPVALAMEWATLAAMFPGRFTAGIGHGIAAWMTQIGEAVDSPLTLLAETITAVRALLAGDTVTLHGRYVDLESIALRFPQRRHRWCRRESSGPNRSDSPARWRTAPSFRKGTGRPKYNGLGS